ncbi:hypothetical protein FACS1894110_05700 [Spirochaetia bacterium]|nr:hypothetical protein FACS1894110_05700 [Spirochaetia bacterium]
MRKFPPSEYLFARPKTKTYVKAIKHPITIEKGNPGRANSRKNTLPGLILKETKINEENRKSRPGDRKPRRLIDEDMYEKRDFTKLLNGGGGLSLYNIRNYVFHSSNFSFLPRNFNKL